MDLGLRPGGSGRTAEELRAQSTRPRRGRGCGGAPARSTPTGRLRRQSSRDGFLYHCSVFHLFVVKSLTEPQEYGPACV